MSIGRQLQSQYDLYFAGLGGLGEFLAHVNVGLLRLTLSCFLQVSVLRHGLTGAPRLVGNNAAPLGDLKS